MGGRTAVAKHGTKGAPGYHLLHPRSRDGLPRVDASALIAANPRREGEPVFAWQSRVVDGLDPDAKHEILFHTRERYDPVDYIAEGERRWRADHGMPEPRADIAEVRADLAKADRVGRFFEDAPDARHDPAVVAAFDDFRAQNAAMWDFVTGPTSKGGLGITVDFVDAPNGEPYPSAKAQAEDLRRNRHISIQTGLGNHQPLLSDLEYDRFRAVHDIFGHASIGRGFDRHGEYQAYLQHSTMYAGAGREAMASEYHGVNSALWSGDPTNLGGTGKAVLLPPKLRANPWDEAGNLVRKHAADDDGIHALIGGLGLNSAWAINTEAGLWHREATMTAILKDAGPDHDTSAMVALYPDADTAEALALEGGCAPDSLHITLAYLGPDVSLMDPAPVVGALTAFDWPDALQGLINGVGRFDPDDRGEGWPLVGLVDVPGLGDFRSDLVDRLADAGVEYATNHDFTPHMTLAYVQPGEETEAVEVLSNPFGRAAVAFDRVVLAWGDRRFEYPFVPAHDLADPEHHPFFEPFDHFGAPPSAGRYVPAAPVIKSDTMARYTLGPMYPAAPESVTAADLDAHGEFATADDLQAMVWDYMRAGDMRLRLQHNPEVVAGEVVEIMAMPGPITVPMQVPGQAPVTKTFPAGTIMMGTVWEPAVWPDVLAGRIKGYSFGGMAQRMTVDLADA